MDQAEITILEVIVEHPLRHVSANETWLPLTGSQLIGRTGFLHAEDTNESFLNLVSFAQAFGPGVFVESALVIGVRAFQDFRLMLSILDKFIRPKGSMMFDKFRPRKPQVVVDKPLKLLSIADGKMPLEDHTIKTGERVTKKTGMLGEKRRY